jgi:hypothetical protein
MQVFGGAGRTLKVAGHVAIADAIAAIEETEGSIYLAGSAASILAEHWPPSRPPPLLGRSASAPDIEWVARLGAAANVETAPAKPLYLRTPDAKPQDSARLPRR